MCGQAKGHCLVCRLINPYKKRACLRILDPATATVKPVEAPIASVPIPTARVAAPGPDPVPRLVD